MRPRPATAEDWVRHHREPSPQPDQLRQFASIGPAKILEALPESREVVLPDRVILGEPHKHTDTPHTIVLIAKASSNSDSLLARTTWICRLTRLAASSTSRSSRSASEKPGLTNTPIVDVPGIISWRSPRRLASNDVPRMADARDITFGAVESRDNTCAERIGGTDKDSFCGFRWVDAANGNDDRSLAINQIGHELRTADRIDLRPSDMQPRRFGLRHSPFLASPGETPACGPRRSLMRDR